MTGVPQTDRDRMLAAEARVAELEEELEAWRANDRRIIHDGDKAMRAFRLAERVRPFLKSPYLGHAPQVARTLIFLLDHAGTIQPVDRLGDAVSTREIDGPNRLGAIAVTWTRAVLSQLGFEGALRNSYGQGYMIEAEVAAAIKARLEPGHD